MLFSDLSVFSLEDPTTEDLASLITSPPEDPEPYETPQTSRSASPVPPQTGMSTPPVLPPRRKKARMDVEGDKALVESLREIQEASRQRRAQKEDMDTNFALEVAGRLKRLPLRQNAYVKLKIQQLLFEIEFSQQESA